MITLPPGSPVGILGRVSSDDQVRDESLVVHMRRGRDYATDDTRRWEVVAVYELEGISGKTVLNEPEMRAMWRDVETGRIKGLIFSAVARLCRNLLEALTIEEHLRTHGCAIITTRRGIIDTSTPEGMDMYISEAWRAQSERLELSARVKAGLRGRAQLGYITGPAPYGYCKVPIPGSRKGKTLAIDQEEGPIRAEIYDLYLKHRRLMVIAEILRDRHLTYRNGEPWNHQHIKKLLLDTSAMGVYYAQRYHAGRATKPESQWVEIPVPALVPVEKWKRCQALLQSKQFIRRRRVVYPYSGLLYCQCKAKMFVRASFDYERQRWRTGRPRYVCRSCGNNILIESLDEGIGRLFRAFLLEGIPDGAEPEVSQSERQMQNLKKKLKQTQESKKRFAKAFGAGKLSLEDFEAYHGPLAAQEKSIKVEIAGLEADQIALSERRASQQVAVEVLQQVAWAEISATNKQRLLAEFVERIELQPHHLAVDLLYLPSLLQLGDDDDGPGFARRLRRVVRRPDQREMPTDRTAWNHCLRTAHEERGDSHKKVAKQMGVIETYLYLLYAYGSTPSPPTIARIVAYIGYVPWCRTPYAQATLGEALRAAREIQGLDQGRLGKQASISGAMISGVEKGKCGMSAAAWDRIERVLGIEIRRVFAAYQRGAESGGT